MKDLLRPHLVSTYVLHVVNAHCLSAEQVSQRHKELNETDGQAGLHIEAVLLPLPLMGHGGKFHSPLSALNFA